MHPPRCAATMQANRAEDDSSYAGEDSAPSWQWPQLLNPFGQRQSGASACAPASPADKDRPLAGHGRADEGQPGDAAWWMPWGQRGLDMQRPARENGAPTATSEASNLHDTLGSKVAAIRDSFHNLGSRAVPC